MRNYFSTDELKCKCCGECRMHPDLIHRLNLTRVDLGEPIYITSGFRCRKHNDKLEKSSPNSSHIYGYAVDIHVHSSSYRYKLIQCLEINGFNRFGIGKNYLHVDMDPSKPKKVIWVY